MRMLASAMAAAAGLGTAAGVALVARHADPPAPAATRTAVARPAVATAPTRTVRIVVQAPSAPPAEPQNADPRKVKPREAKPRREQHRHGPKPVRGHPKPKDKR